MADELVEAVARDRFAKKCLDVFNAGIVRRPDAKNPRGYTDYYSPYEAMMAVIALVREAERADVVTQDDSLVEVVAQVLVAAKIECGEHKQEARHDKA